MKDTIFLLVKVTLKTKYVTVHEAVNELQQKAVFNISDTKGVKVEKTELMQYKLKH
jgi:hypothetical protein